MDGAEVGVLKQASEVRFGGLLKRQFIYSPKCIALVDIVNSIPYSYVDSYLEGTQGCCFELQSNVTLLCNLFHEPLEGGSPDKQLSGLLVSPDLPEGNCAGPVSVGLLDSSGGGGRLPGSLSGELLPRSLSSSRLASGLLGTSHFDT